MLWLAGLHPVRLARSAAWTWRLYGTRGRRRRERRLTVAVDVSSLWQPMTGIGWYLYRLLEAMAERDDVRLRLYGPRLIDAGDAPAPVRPLPAGPALEEVRVAIPADFSIPREVLTPWLRRRIDRRVGADGNALLFAPNYLFPPPWRGVPGARVAVVHDLSAYEVPETLRESTLGELRSDLERGIRRARRVITDSETVRSEITARGLAPRSRVDVAPLAPALDGGAAAGGSGAAEEPAGGGRYVLFVGTLEPRKNLPMLIEAFRRWRRRHGDAVELVLCGGVGWKAEDIERAVEGAAAEGWLRAPGYVTDAALARFYRGAEWLALPSLYEGFGLPAVEAMASEVPLLLADIPVLREVAGDAALYAPARDVDAWTSLLTRALGDPGLRRRMAERSSRRGERFRWSLTADATVAAWRRAAGER